MTPEHRIVSVEIRYVPFCECFQNENERLRSFILKESYMVVRTRRTGEGKTIMMPHTFITVYAH